MGDGVSIFENRHCVQNVFLNLNIHENAVQILNIIPVLMTAFGLEHSLQKLKQMRVANFLNDQAM